MNTENSIGETASLRLANVSPFLSITVLECTGEDPGADFRSLVRFLRRSAGERGQAESLRIRAAITVTGADSIDEVGILGELGFDDLYGIAREVTRRAAWADKDSVFVDVTNQLTLALRRNRLVAVHSQITSDVKLGKWVRQGSTPYRFVPGDRLTATFQGDGRMLWMRGIHRRRTTKADGKSLTGLRIQDSLNSVEDSTYALTAAKVAYLPEDAAATLRDLLVVSADKSKISWKRTSHFLMFLAATGEALDLIEKALAADESPDPPFGELAVREVDLRRVRGAFDVSVSDPDQVRGEPDADDDRIARAEFLYSRIVDVRGEPGSSRAIVDIGEGSAVAGTLVLKPMESAGSVHLDVGILGTPSAERVVREAKEAIMAGDLLTIHYESGHAFNGQQVFRENLVGTPFPHLEFAHFSGFTVTREKPAVRGDQAIHDAIAKAGDDSLFAWVVRKFGRDWLLCDDGAGEVADFLHLADDGTLTAIHVKAARNGDHNRRIAVSPFEQVVSQAEKNIRLLRNDPLVARLETPRIAAPAAWHNGRRVDSGDFVAQLRTRVATDRTKVVIVQPHLLRSRHDTARADAAAGRVNRDTCSLALLDNLLHSTRRTVTALWDDLTVIGCA